MIRSTALALISASLMSAAAAAQTSTDILIGVINTDASSAPVYANERDFFTRAGLNAIIATFANGKQMLDALAAGIVDVGFANTVSGIGAIQGGTPLTIIAPGAIYDRTTPITMLVQAASSNFVTGRDLSGKTLGVPAAGGGGEVFTRAWIDANGGDSRTVHYLTGIPSTQIAAALAEHRIDAAELSEPTLTIERQKGTIKPLASLDVVGARYYIGVYMANKTWTASHPARARAFSAVMRDTARWANVHRDETAPILAARLHVSTDVTAAMVRATYGDILMPQFIQPVIDLSVKYGALKPARAVDLIGPDAVRS